MAAFLVIQAARFGDLVQSKRLLLSLRGQGETHLAVDHALVPLARLLYPFALVHGLAVHGGQENQALERNRAVLAAWQAAKFDAIYNCNFSGLTAALCRIFESERVHGYRQEGGGLLRSPWARLAFRLSEKRALSSLNIVDFWAHFVPAPLSAASVNPVAAPGGQGLGVVLAGRESRRSLPVAVLAEVLRTAFGALGGPRVRLLGTRAEQPAARRLQRLLPAKVQERVEDLSGKTDWPALADAVSGLDALLTPDTGIMHLAAHVGVPVLGFFLSSAWCHETGPYGLGHHVWQAQRACAPCLESAPCPYETACLPPFSRSDLLRSLAAVLGSTGQAPALQAGLQLWQGGLDALGAAPQLLAGDDPQAARRQQVRAFLAQWPALSPVPGAACDLAEDADLTDWLYNDADWMLPPGRYC